MARNVVDILRPVHRRMVLAIGRAIVRLVDDAAKVQKAQVTVLAGETKAVERFQQYGFTSVPLAGMEGIVVFPGAAREHGVMVAIGDRMFRLKGLQPGEVALYTDEGDRIVLKRGREIEIVAGTKVRVETPRLEVTGDIVDRCDEQARTVRGMREVYDAHTHPENDAGGPTDPPVQKMGTA